MIGLLDLDRLEAVELSDSLLRYVADSNHLQTTGLTEAKLTELGPEFSSCCARCPPSPLGVQPCLRGGPSGPSRMVDRCQAVGMTQRGWLAPAVARVTAPDDAFVLFERSGVHGWHVAVTGDQSCSWSGWLARSSWRSSLRGARTDPPRPVAQLRPRLGAGRAVPARRILGSLGRGPASHVRRRLSGKAPPARGHQPLRNDDLRRRRVMKRTRRPLRLR